MIPLQRDTFSYLITNPGDLSAADLTYLEQLVTEYPFCQLGHVILAKGYNNEPHTEHASVSLRKAAAYSLSRNGLRKFIGGEFPDVTPSESLPFVKRHPTVVVEEKVQVPEEKTVTPSVSPDYTDVLLKDAEELSEKEKQKNLDQLSIIDRFIKAEPRIGPLRAKLGQPSEEDPIDLAQQKPQQVHSTPVTESYAKVLARQGKTEKAIEVYEKLQLKFPEKKSYFAGKIDELRTRLSLF